MTDLGNLPPLPTDWHWENRSPCYTKVAAHDREACAVWLGDDGDVVIDGDDWDRHSAPVRVVAAVLKANGVTL